MKFSRYLKNILCQLAFFPPPLLLELRTVVYLLDMELGAKLNDSTNTNINNDWFQVSGDLESLSEDNWAQAAGLPAWRSAGLRSRKKGSLPRHTGDHEVREQQQPETEKKRKREREREKEEKRKGERQR